MEATAIHANLVESIRRNKLRLLIDHDKLPLSPTKQVWPDMEPTSPAINFGDLFVFDKGGPVEAEYKKLHDQANDLVLQRKFMLPYRKCFYYYRTGREDSFGRPVPLSEGYYVCALYLVQDSDTAIFITTFNKAFGPNNKEVTDYWFIPPMEEIKIGPKLARGLTNVLFMDRASKAVQKRWLHDLGTDMTCLRAGTMLLHAANARQELAPLGDTAAACNRGRALAKLKPLGDIINVRLTPNAQEIVGTREPGVGSTRDKCPHDRRGNWAYYKKWGKRVWRESSKVNGGRTKAPIYNIKP